MKKKPTKSETKRMMQSIGRKGGIQRAKNLSAKKRREIARKAARVRWKKP